MPSYQEAAGFEHGFWLQVLGDHARFIHDSLAPKEKESITAANAFKEEWDHLLERSKKNPDISLSRQAEEVSRRFRKFKLELIARHLTGDISMGLGPTFLNHMVNELEEYLRVLKYLTKGEKPPIFHELHHHLLWLLDAAGHAGAISDNMDRIEKQIKKQSDQFTTDFEAFYLKAVEMAGFLRTEVNHFPALERFNDDIKLEMKLFMGFLDEIEEMELSKAALGTFAALMADHMLREECYYLTKLAEATSQQGPECNPTKPRL